jgi:hypothetical protein
LAYLEGKHPDGGRGLSGSFGPKGKYAKQGQRARDGFARYVKLDKRDARPVAELTLAEEVDVGSHRVQTTVDVVVFADTGYSGRILNWDRAGVSEGVADALAAPAALLIDRELGEETCVDIEVWDLGSSEKWALTREAALGHVEKLARLLDQVEAAIYP